MRQHIQKKIRVILSCVDEEEEKEKKSEREGEAEREKKNKLRLMELGWEQESKREKISNLVEKNEWHTWKQ